MASRSPKKNLSLKAPTITLEQIDDLANLWGENSRSQIIIRCIERVWSSIAEGQKKQNDTAGKE